MPTHHRNVILLGVCQAIFICGQTTLIFLGGLLGFALAGDKSLATLPVSAVILGTATMTIPASLFMRRVGRRAGFMTGACVGVIGVLVCALALHLSSFWLFALGALTIGFYNAFCQYYRFAAADAAPPAFRAKAISLVLAGGVVAGVIGPSLATATRDLVAPISYLGSYIALALLTLLALLLVSFVRIPRLSEAQRKEKGRPLPVIMRQPRFLIAALSSMIGYGIMSLLMTATPLAMIACDHPHAEAGYVIQWHVVGMFAPSFFSGHLISRFGVNKIMLTGAGLLAACVVVALSGISVTHFWVSLFLMGIGWNFLFVGGSTMLTTVYTTAERAKTQAAHDFMVFATTAGSSFLSGKLLHEFGWQTINYVAVPFIAGVTILVLWYAVAESRRDRPATSA